MASNFCPQCGSQLNGNEKFCPECGFSIKASSAEQVEPEVITDKQASFESAPAMQSVLEATPLEPVKKKKTGKVIIAIIIIALIAGILFVYSNYKKQDYYNNMVSAAYLMLDGGAKAETCCNLVVSVWNNSIWETPDTETDKFTKNSDGIFYDDFNDALAELYSDTDFQNQLSEIQNNQSEVVAIMKELKNPPTEYETEYDLLMEYYDVYAEFTGMALNPIGSLNTFSDNFSETDEEFVSLLQKLELYFE